MSWQTRPLAEVADFNLGKMLDQNKNRGELRPYLANVNVRWGEFQLDDLREMRFEEHELDKFGVRTGDILMCEGGEPGRCAIWTDQMPGMMFQKALHRIRPHSCLDSRFLYYSFLRKGRMDGFAGLFTGSTIKHLPKEKLAKVEITFPSLPEQQSIAATLSAYDELIDNNRRRIALLEEAARQLYKEWFVRFRFPGHEHVRIIGGVPEGWEPLKLGDVLTLQRGFDLPNGDRLEGTVPVYGSTGIVGYHATAKVDAPMIVTGRSGSLGQVCFVSVPSWPLNTALWVRDFKRVSPWYAYFLLSEIGLEKFNGGASVPTLDRKVAHAADVMLPPDSLMASFDETAQTSFAMIENLKSQNAELAKARDLLLPRLMSGSLAA